MFDSAKYPGLCKQYDENQVVDNEYADLEFNSINDREGDASRISAQHFTYKTYNGEYENKRRNNANNGLGPYVNRANYNRISNNEVHSFVKRHQQSQVSRQQQQQQQYTTNGASSFPQMQQLNQQQQQQQPNYQLNPQQMTPFLQAIQQQQQQHTQKRPVDRTNPFQTYRWNELFKNHV